MVKEYVTVCPQCKATDVSMDKSNPLQPYLGLPAMYICNNCGHTGNIFPEVELSKLDEFENEVKKKHLSDTKKDDSPLVDISYGNFVVRVIWKILGPVFLFGGIVIDTPIHRTILMFGGIFLIYIAYFKKRKLKE